MLDAGAGGEIEYVLTEGDAPEGRPLIVCENGLGAPLESWDWILHHLHGDFSVLRYHRRGYSRTNSVERPAVILERLLDALAPAKPCAS